MPHAYAYIRWSSTAQQAGDSETRQLAELARFEKETGIKIVKKYRDDGRSAFRGDDLSGNFLPVRTRDSGLGC